MQLIVESLAPLVCQWRILLWVAVTLPCLWILWTASRSSLRRYPGPILAKWTNLWRLYHVSTGQWHDTLDDLHRKFGPVVRIGPNMLDLDFPELVKTIYGVQGHWQKTELYHASSAKVGGKIVYNLFSETDERAHDRQKKPIAKYYSAAGVSVLEPHVDKIIDQFCNELATRYANLENRQPCDLGEWMLYYAWDVVGEITFSQPVGYLEHGYDFDGTLANAEKALDYFAVIGQIPFLDFVFAKNPVYKLFGPPGFDRLTQISIGHLMNRYTSRDTNTSEPDFLDKFMEAKKAYPDIVDDAQIISYLMINLLAGADTTAITLRAVFYYVLKNPNVWAKLENEVLTSASGSTVSLKHARRLPYLDAVIREALRMHPGVGLTMERYVPSTGLRLPDGCFVPARTIVGMNAFIVNRNKKIFGNDADVFRPERWIQDEDETLEHYQERLKQMNNTDLAFGAGSRVCLGKHIGIMEIFKVTASLIARFRFELAEPERGWNLINSWFVRQSGLKVNITAR